MKALLFILAWILTGYWPAAGRTLRVGKGMEFDSINKAIHHASAGDTVWVFSGWYREKNILIDKPLFLIGDHWPVLDGEHQYEIISIKADHVVVDGFKLVHSGVSSLVDIAGIRIYETSHVQIVNNIFEDTFFGVYVQSGNLCLIRDNRFTSYSQMEQQSGNGIHCWKCDSLLIVHNTITGHRDGIYFEFVTHSIILGNTSSHNIRYGLHFMFSHQDDYIGNRFLNNGAGVSVMFSHGVKMIRNLFADNWGDGGFGLLLKEISDSYVFQNTFRNNTSAVFMEGASRIKFFRNEFTGNGWGLKIQASCLEIDLSWNNFRGNSFDVGTNGTLVLNNFDYNYWDKYEGYDLRRDGFGDVPFHPVSLFSMVVEKNPNAMMLFRSVLTGLLDKAERMLPSLTPENLKDNHPVMDPIKL